MEANNPYQEISEHQEISGDIQNSTIKQEIASTIEEENFNIQVKTETDNFLDNSITENDTVNEFDNIEIQIKEEITVSLENDDSQTSSDAKQMKDSIEMNEETESILPTSPNDVDLKLETQLDENLGQELEQHEDLEQGTEQDSVVSYDYPSFDDSMDSSEAAALSHVEACLSDEINIKFENDIYDDNQKDTFPKIIKQESELTVTETHLISNKLINTTSTITNTHHGIIESQTTKTLVMEILPMTHHQNLKIGNPEEILPTQNDMYNMDCTEMFQLNSITGNVLSLEQEAYGLLKTKKKIDLVSREYHCPKCPKTFKAKYGFQKHLKVHESIEKREQGFLRGWKTRKENQTKKAKLLKAAEDDAKETIKKEEVEGYKCTCGQVFQRRSRMETCLRSHTDFTDSRTYACPTCDKKFKSKDLLIFHRNRQHRKKYPCKFCPTDYHTQKELFKHLQVHQKVQLMEYKVISEVAKGNQELQCLICPKTCSKLSDLKSHLMDDHKEPYSCPHCKHTFTRILDFANHIKKTHPDVGGQSVLDVLGAFSKLVKAWKCEECGQQFHKADKLALHQVDEHVPELKNEQHFQCEDCQRVFVSNQGLNSHKRMHHRSEKAVVAEPEEVGVMCLECRKICQDMNALTSHMRLHSMDRKYPCKYCDFRFSTPQKRKKHAEIHTGDMKYVCFICEYQCSSENRLKHHKMSLKHLNMKEYLLTGKPLVEEEQTTSRKEKIKDTLRKKEWGVKKKKKEKRDKESETPEVACDICGEKFSDESAMLEHKQTHPFIEFPNDDKPSRIFFK